MAYKNIENGKRYYEKNREYILEWQRRYYKNNLEKIKGRHKQYRENNREKRAGQTKQWRIDNPGKVKDYRRTRYEEKKQYIDDYKLLKGCAICGYNKCAEALDFHHNEDKEFGVNSSNYNKSLDQIKKEMDKCIVLCSNCHRELHAKLKE